MTCAHHSEESRKQDSHDLEKECCVWVRNEFGGPKVEVEEIVAYQKENQKCYFAYYVLKHMEC